MHPYPFGENTAWFAFKTTDVARVRALFDAGAWREVGWETGVNASYELPDERKRGQVLVTPPIDSFVLVTTRGFLGWAPGGDRILPRLVRHGDLSTRASEWAFDLDMEVHYYAAERHLDLYSWGRYRYDDEYDAYRELTHHADEILLSTGKLSAEERALADEFLLTDYCPRERVAELRDELRRGLDEQRITLVDHAGSTVPAPEPISSEDLHTLAALLVGVRPDQVAARWSVDPNDFDARTDAHDISPTCWLGEVAL